MYKNILVSALVNLGDVVLTTSALALIKKNFPDARITMLVKRVVADAVVNNPVVDDVIILDYRAKDRSVTKIFSAVKDIRRRRFDLYISLDRKLRPALLAWLARIPKRVGADKVFDDKKSRVTKLYTDVIAIDHDLDRTLQARTYQTIVKKFFGLDGWAEPVFARITDEARAKVDRLFERLPSAKKKIALCVKGTFELKTYPKEYFAEIVRVLRAEYEAAFFIVGAPSDREYAESFNGAPPTLPPTNSGAQRRTACPPASAAPATFNGHAPASTAPNFFEGHAPASTAPAVFDSHAPAQSAPATFDSHAPAQSAPDTFNGHAPASAAPATFDSHAPASSMTAIPRSAGGATKSVAPACIDRIENFCGETSLVDLAEIFNRADLFISVDTGAAHIAATTAVPMVVMFGCTPVERWHPINPNAIALSSNEPCCPCSVKPEQCPSFPKPNCLWHVDSNVVIDACRKLLEGDHDARQ